MRSLASQIADKSPRCKCGGKGLYRVGIVTYCTTCRPKAVALLSKDTRRNKRIVARGKQLDEIDRYFRRINRKHR